MRYAAALIALAAALPAYADKTDKAEKIDLASVADKLDAYRDDLGNYYVFPKDGAFERNDAEQWVFYGDGKTLYRQRVLGGNAKDHRWTLWAPRAIGMMGGYLDLGDKPTLSCRQHDKGAAYALKPLGAEELRTLLKNAKALPALHQRSAHLLARDDDGTYYYVDELRSEYGGNGYRVFAGQKGAMKELPVTNIVRDSAGEIFGTKQGLIKVTAAKEPAVFWIKSGKKTELTDVDIVKDHYLIYRELGIYGSLGSICEDL
jgi:hypothetical protein